MRRIDQNDPPGGGGFERINAYAYFAWLVVLAIAVMRQDFRRRKRATSAAMPDTGRRSLLEDRYRSTTSAKRPLSTLASWRRPAMPSVAPWLLVGEM
jgi:hypothetical protein